MKHWLLAAGVIALLIILKGTMRLSKNFTLTEFTRTSKPFLNIPSTEQMANLNQLAVEILQPIRNKWGRIEVSSGFRSLDVNAAVGGSASSQHMKGEAADIIPLDALTEVVYRWIISESGLSYGQAVYEVHGDRKWIHISLPREYRRNQDAFLLINGIKTYA